MPVKKPGRTNPKRKTPRMGKDETAAISKVARDLAKELNAQVDEAKREKLAKLTPSERKALEARRERLRTRRRTSRRGVGNGKRLYCHGLNLKGKSCGAQVLIPQNWDGPEEITGDYCLWHEPTITQDQRDSYNLFGTSKKQTFRKVTPAELAHQLIQRSPHHFLDPYLKALGLKLDDDGNLLKVSTGLKIHGFSRGGDVIKSPYADLAGQIQVVEKLYDRVYGKARQAVDLASSNTTVAVNIEMNLDRVDQVSAVLARAGALPNGNGNGHVIEGTAEPLDSSLD